MNKKWILGTLASLLLVSSIPAASAGSGPHATVVIVPISVSCTVTPVSLQLDEVTITVGSDCRVTVDYYSNMYSCLTSPRTLSTGRLTVQLNYDCSVVVTAKV